MKPLPLLLGLSVAIALACGNERPIEPDPAGYDVEVGVGDASDAADAFKPADTAGIGAVDTSDLASPTDAADAASDTTATGPDTTLDAGGGAVGGDVIKVAGGRQHTCALKKSGSVHCWGRGVHGQLGDGSLTAKSGPVAVKGLTDAVAITAGREHTCALRKGGDLVCWGRNDQGQLGDGTKVTRKAEQAGEDRWPVRRHQGHRGPELLLRAQERRQRYVLGAELVRSTG